MDLKIEILKTHSKANTERILQWIGQDIRKMDQLIELFQLEDQKIMQRSAWVVSFLSEHYPSCMEKHLPMMIARMVSDNVHVGVRRNMIRSLQFINIPTDLQGEVLTACFSFLENPKEGNVVQVFALSVIEKLTGDYPELIPELKLRIEMSLENEPSPAFRSRARKTLNRLRNIRRPI